MTNITDQQRREVAARLRCGEEVFADPDGPSRYCPMCGAEVV